MKPNLSIFLLLTFLSLCLMNKLLVAQDSEPLKPAPSADSLPLDKAGETSGVCPKKLEKIIYLPPQKLSNFIKQLNSLGKCGYVMDKVSKLNQTDEATFADVKVFGTVKPDFANTYEYEWFEVESPGEIVTRANFRAAKGFYFRKNLMFLAGRCGRAVEKKKEDLGSLGGLIDILGNHGGTNGSVLIFERKNGIVKKNEYRVLNGADDDGKKARVRNQKTLDESAALGFRPVGIYYLGVFDVFAIIMEKDETLKPEGEYLILRQHLSFNKKLTELAKSGYSPLMIGFSFAVLHRKTAAPIDVAYESEVTPYQVKKNMHKWSRPYYRTAGLDGQQIGCDLSESNLFFSTSTDIHSPNYDYVFLPMTDVYERAVKKKDKTAAFTDPPTREMLHEFESLSDNGYIVRDVLFANEIFVIFERIQKKVLF